MLPTLDSRVSAHSKIITGFSMNLCPKCQSDHTQRVHRDWWMRLLPGSRSIHCSDCGERSIIRANSTPLVDLMPLISASTPLAPRTNYSPYSVSKVSDLRRFQSEPRGELLQRD